MPYSDTFTLCKIIVTFTLENGQVSTLETQVTEREVAKATYQQAVEQGKTAVFSCTSSSPKTKAMLRIMLGNFPPKSKAYLRAICSQQLFMEDLSYCFQLPLTFVPPYMGNIQTYVTKGVSFKGESVPAKNLSSAKQSAHEVELMEFLSQPVSARSDVIWDVQVKVKSQAKISRIASINHAIEFTLSSNEQEATIQLASSEDRKKVPGRDFVLYLRDEMVNKPVGIVNVLPDGD